MKTGVQIFVRDTRNILLVRSLETNSLGNEALINLQYALEIGLCTEYQIDEDEISSELIGEGNHRSILYWESAEGGAGILQNIVENPEAMSRITRRALEICHFNPDNGDEFSATTECVRACYKCLLKYYNQPHHHILNRNLIKDLLLKLSHSSTQQSYENRTYNEHYEWLRRQTDSRSQLEKDFLDYLYRNALRLPDFAQKEIPDYPSRPDFYYESGYVCIFCDGSVHDEPHQRAEDQRVRHELRAKGFRVVVILYDRTLDEQVEESKDVFGAVR